MRRRHWIKPPHRQSLFSVFTSIGKVRLHVCGLCGALTRDTPIAQMQHARYHVLFDRLDDSAS